MGIVERRRGSQRIRQKSRQRAIRALIVIGPLPLTQPLRIFRYLFGDWARKKHRMADSPACGAETPHSRLRRAATPHLVEPASNDARPYRIQSAGSGPARPLCTAVVEAFEFSLWVHPRPDGQPSRRRRRLSRDQRRSSSSLAPTFWPGAARSPATRRCRNCRGAAASTRGTPN